MASVVVVEDDPTTALMVRATFEGAGHWVRVLTDPQEVLSALVAAPPDALILDIVLPGTSGWKILETIRAEPATAAIPVLLLSSLDGSQHRIQGLRGGASDYLTKPFVPDELLLRVERMLKKSVPSTADLEGNLENFPFWELLQSLQNGRRSGRLELKGAVSGFVELGRGAVVVAHSGSLREKEALLALSDATGGRFVFHPTPPDDESVQREAIFVNGLIMTAAMLQDELDRRRAFLPASDQPLEAVAGKLPALAEAFQEVDVQKIHRHLASRPGMPLEELLEAELAAPKKVVLSLALLCEHGLVRPKATAPARAVPHAEVRASQPMHQLLLCQPAAWEQLIEKLKNRPEGEASETAESLCEQLALRRGGSARLRRGEVDFHLHVLLLEKDTVARALATLPLCSCLVLWLAGEDSIAGAAGVLNSFQQRPEETRGIHRRGILIAPTESILRAAHQRTADSSRWRVLSKVPESLEEFADLAL